MTDYTRIPAPVESEADRRTLCAILAAIGLEVRVVRVKATERGSVRRYVEYRPGPDKPLIGTKEG